MDIRLWLYLFSYFCDVCKGTHFAVMGPEGSVARSSSMLRSAQMIDGDSAADGAEDVA